LLLVLLAGSGGLLLAGTTQLRVTPSEGEARALWVVRDSLRTPASIAQVVQHAVANGFNTLLVQVRGRAEAYYSSGVEPRAQALAGQPAAFDPLQSVLEAAHTAGLKVHAWVNVNLVSSAAALPSSRDHVVHRHPEWLMVPRALAQDLGGQPTHGPGYVGTLARWSRAQSAIEGLYLSPAVPAAAAYTVSVVDDLARRYALDGVHLDYVRYPGPEFDYSRAALGEFRTAMMSTVPAPERSLLDRRSRDDVLAWADAYPEQWADFRRSRLTALVMKLRTAVRQARPGALLSAAVAPDATEAFATKYQDWRLWAEAGLLDVLCPMAYTTNVDLFRRQVAEAVRISPPAQVWAGIGAYRLPAAQTVSHIEAARALGVRGVALFSYDALGPATEAYLDIIKRTVFSPGASAAGSER
jgi:uncharacterized lipoprotein YddW (UPF0748 family)